MARRPAPVRMDPVRQALQEIPPALRLRMWAALPPAHQAACRRVEALLSHEATGDVPDDAHDLLLRIAHLDRPEFGAPASTHALVRAVVDALPGNDDADGNRYVPVAGKLVTDAAAVRHLSKLYEAQRDALLAELASRELAAQAGMDAADKLLSTPEGARMRDAAQRNVERMSPEALARLRAAPAVTPSSVNRAEFLNSFRQRARRPGPEG